VKYKHAVKIVVIIRCILSTDTS